MTKPRVLFVAAVSDFVGGAERSLFDLIANPNIEPILAVPAEGELSRFARERSVETVVYSLRGLPAVKRPFTLRKNLSAVRDLVLAARDFRRLARDVRADLVHSNGLKAHVIVCAAAMFGLKRRVVHFRDIPDTTGEKLVWRFLGLMANRVVLVTRDCWPFASSAHKVSVIHNAIVPDITEAPPAASGPLTLGFVGRLYPGKGLHMLIDWMKHARDAGLDLRMIVRGAYAPGDVDYPAKIEQQVRDLGLVEHFQFDGFVEDRTKLYSGIDLVCVPSINPEPLARSIMEGMSRGLAVVATPTGGTQDMLVDGVTGYICRDAERFTEIVRPLFEDRGRLVTLGAAGKEVIIAKFGMDRLHREITAVYASCGVVFG